MRIHTVISFFMLCVQITASTKAIHNYEKSAALLSNSQSIVEPLDFKLNRAFDMYSARAYLHQYEEHGVTQDSFDEKFVLLEQVLQNYKSL